MEDYYTNKERHIHLFLSDKGWSDEDISKAMFNLTVWTAVMCMPIEFYYTSIMKGCDYTGYKNLIAGISTEDFIYYSNTRRRRISIIIVVTSLLGTVLFTLLKGGL